MKGLVVPMLVLGMTGMVWAAPSPAPLAAPPGVQLDNTLRPMPDDTFPVTPPSTRTSQQGFGGSQELGPGVRFEVRIGLDAITALKQGQTVESQFKVPDPSGSGLLPPSAVGEVALLLKVNEGQANLPAVGMQPVPTGNDTLRFELTPQQLDALNSGSLNYTIPLDRRFEYTRVEFVGSEAVGGSFTQPTSGFSGNGGQVLPLPGPVLPGDSNFMGPVHEQQLSSDWANVNPAGWSPEVARGPGNLNFYNEQVVPPGRVQTIPLANSQGNPPLATQGNVGQAGAWDSPSLDVRPQDTSGWQGQANGGNSRSVLPPNLAQSGTDPRSSMAPIQSGFGANRDDFQNNVQNNGLQNRLPTEQELAQRWNSLQMMSAQLDQRDVAQSQQASRLQRMEQQLQSLIDNAAPPERLAERRPLEEQLQPVSTRLDSNQRGSELGSQVPTLPPVSGQTAAPEKKLAESKADRGREMGAVYLLLLASLGLNAYLGLLCRSFYFRYNDLSEELRETFTTSVV